MRYTDKQKAFRDENELNAFEVMTDIFSAQATYQADNMDLNFGSEIELFKNDLINENLACALGCPYMKSFNGKVCKGSSTPYFGYRFHLSIIKGNNQTLADFRFADFNLVAFHAVDQTNYRSFFIDRTGVIRFSDNLEILASVSSPMMDEALYTCTCEQCS